MIRYPLLAFTLVVTCSIASAQTRTTKPVSDSRLRAPHANPAVEPIPVVIELVDDVRDLNGSLLDTADLEVKTAFGVAMMPLKAVLGIRMARSDSEVTTVVLSNGDMITGTVDIENVLVQTSWGKSKVDGKHLASIFFDEGLSWTPLKLLAGQRWTLSKADELAPAPTRRASAVNSQSGGPRQARSVLIRP